MNSYQILSSHYTIEKELSNSSYKGIVYLASDPSLTKYAIKTISSYLSSSPFSLTEEANIHQNLIHKNIIPFHDYKPESTLTNKYTNEKNVMYLATEYAENGDLLTFLQKANPSTKQIGLRFKLARSFFTQIIDAISYIHDQGYVHRDIKLENILLNKDYQVKVADFGCSASLEANENGQPGLNSVKGTEAYMAPEIWENQSIKKKKYDGEKIDVFSLGVSLFAMIFNGMPFNKAFSRDKLYRLIWTESWEEYWDCFKTKVKNIEDLEGEEWRIIRDLLQKMMDKKPENRPSLKEIKDSIWMKGDIFTDTEISDLCKELIGD